uniref:Uncharacterized protein n=1 Tax=Timema poppense TaxID=170557 RepID=A0A7R9DS83_TIMPO|nr:unnamed protein product [Timema poppensis]
MKLALSVPCLTLSMANKCINGEMRVYTFTVVQSSSSLVQPDTSTLNYATETDITHSYSSPMASLVLIDSSQLSSDSQYLAAYGQCEAVRVARLARHASQVSFDGHMLPVSHETITHNARQ